MYVALASSTELLYIPFQLTGKTYNRLLATSRCAGYALNTETDTWSLMGVEEAGSMVTLEYAMDEDSGTLIMPLWMNYEMSVAAQDENGNYVDSGTKVDIIVRQVDYNGTTIPNIPQDIYETYPHVIVLRVTNGEQVAYQFIKSKSEILYLPPELTYPVGYLYFSSNVEVGATVDGAGMWLIYTTELGNLAENGRLPIYTEQNFSISLVWANHDIMIASEDADGNIVATDKVYDYIVDFVDYNGVILPELPQVDYSYAVILDATDNPNFNGYSLVLFRDKCYAILGDMIDYDYDILFSGSSYLLYGYTESIGNWMLLAEDDSEIPIEDPNSPLSLVWSNKDIMVSVPYDYNMIFETDEVYFPLRSEGTLPDVEYWSDYYIVPKKWLSSVAKQTRRLTGDYTRMTTDKIEEALTDLGNYKKVFYKTIAEIDFKLPEYIAPYCFAYCMNLKSASGDNVLIVDNDAFMECRKLHSVSFPNAISLGEYSFGGCGSLINVELPLVKEIGYGSFAECYNLVSIDLPNAVTVADSCFRNCDKLENVNIPKVEMARYSMFYNCISITKIDLPSVVSIGDTWNNYVFYGCKNLTAVILRSTTMVTALGDNNQQMFYDTPIANGTGYIYVPAALIDTYKADTAWSTYASQFRALEDYTVDGTITGELDENKV